MIGVQDLPALNAALNFGALVFLVSGRELIRRKRVVGHKRCMVAAYVISIGFLTSYLTYRFLGEEKRFGGQGWIRPVYFSILISHVALAAMVPVLSTWSLYLGLKSRIERHRRVARVTYAIWVYVSLTGILVYVLLFQLYGPVLTKE